MTLRKSVEWIMNLFSRNIFQFFTALQVSRLTSLNSALKPCMFWIQCNIIWAVFLCGGGIKYQFLLISKDNWLVRLVTRVPIQQRTKIKTTQKVNKSMITPAYEKLKLNTYIEKHKTSAWIWNSRLKYQKSSPCTSLCHSTNFSHLSTRIFRLLLSVLMRFVSRTLPFWTKSSFNFTAMIKAMSSSQHDWFINKNGNVT